MGLNSATADPTCLPPAAVGQTARQRKDLERQALIWRLKQLQPSEVRQLIAAITVLPFMVVRFRHVLFYRFNQKGLQRFINAGMWNPARARVWRLPRFRLSFLTTATTWLAYACGSIKFDRTDNPVPAIAAVTSPAEVRQQKLWRTVPVLLIGQGLLLPSSPFGFTILYWPLHMAVCALSMGVHFWPQREEIWLMTKALVSAFRSAEVVLSDDDDDDEEDESDEHDERESGVAPNLSPDSENEKEKSGDPVTPTEAARKAADSITNFLLKIAAPVMAYGNGIFNEGAYLANIELPYYAKLFLMWRNRGLAGVQSIRHKHLCVAEQPFGVERCRAFLAHPEIEQSLNALSGGEGRWVLASDPVLEDNYKFEQERMEEEKNQRQRDLEWANRNKQQSATPASVWPAPAPAAIDLTAPLPPPQPIVTAASTPAPPPPPPPPPTPPPSFDHPGSIVIERYAKKKIRTQRFVEPLAASAGYEPEPFNASRVDSETGDYGDEPDFSHKFSASSKSKQDKNKSGGAGSSLARWFGFGTSHIPRAGVLGMMLTPRHTTHLPAGTDMRGAIPIRNTKTGQTAVLCFSGSLVPNREPARTCTLCFSHPLPSPPPVLFSSFLCLMIACCL